MSGRRRVSCAVLACGKDLHRLATLPDWGVPLSVKVVWCPDPAERRAAALRYFACEAASPEEACAWPDVRAVLIGGLGTVLLSRLAIQRDLPVLALAPFASVREAGAAWELASLLESQPFTCVLPRPAWKLRALSLARGHMLIREQRTLATDQMLPAAGNSSVWPGRPSIADYLFSQASLALAAAAPWSPEIAATDLDVAGLHLARTDGLDVLAATLVASCRSLPGDTGRDIERSARVSCSETGLPTSPTGSDTVVCEIEIAAGEGPAQPLCLSIPGLPAEPCSPEWTCEHPSVILDAALRLVEAATNHLPADAFAIAALHWSARLATAGRTLSSEGGNRAGS